MASVRDTFAPDTPARNPRPHTRERVPATVVTVACHNDPRTLNSQWQELECLSGLPFMSYAWAEARYQNAALARDQEPVIATGRDEQGNLLFILPLVLETRGPVRLLLWPGGTHAAYQSGLFTNRCRAMVRCGGAEGFRRDVMVALSARGHAVVWGLRAFLKAKSAIKNSPAPVAHLFPLPPLSRLLN